MVDTEWVEAINEAKLQLDGLVEYVDIRTVRGQMLLYVRYSGEHQRKLVERATDGLDGVCTYSV